MHIQDEMVESTGTGHRIFRREISPTDGEVTGVFLMLHGLGDHQGCHIEAAELFSDKGFAIVGIDWPGNGESEGIRGDIPGVTVACKLIDETLEFIEDKFPGKPIGLYGHSTGGFFSLRYLGIRKMNPFRWIWLSSPLVNPRHGKPPFLQKLAPIVARWFPKLTVSSGVTREKCRHIRPDNPAPGTHLIEDRHRRVSLRLGADLLAHADQIPEVIPVLADPTTLLITQGDEDDVCPGEFSQPLFEKIQLTDKNYALLHGLRHEMFREPANVEFLKIVEHWIADLTV